MSKPDINALKNNVFGLVDASRKQLAQGEVDLSPVEGAVRAFCDALAGMPVSEAQPFVPDLNLLSEQMNALEHDLQAARNTVKRQLAELNTHNVAHRAYKKSDGIGQRFFPPEEEDDE